MERAALAFGGGDLQDMGKAVARTWLGAARELVGDPVSRDSRASLILLYIETAVRYDPDLARQDAALVTEAPKKLAAAKDSPRPGVPTEADLKVVMDREVRELERSVEKAKVRRSEGYIRSLATAFEAYAVDHNKYPAGTADELEKLLSPTYIRVMPRVDAWGTPYKIEVLNNRQDYRITSAGADRIFEKRGPLGCPEDKGTAVEVSDPRRDLVFFDGRFVQSVR
jgi:Type II secretion system (T2SS), protein G